MAADPLTEIGTRKTPQSQRILGPEGDRQVENSAGGYVFSVGEDARLMRFLTLGTDGGTFYASQKDLTVENAKVVLSMAQTRGIDLVNMIVEVSVAGRAPRQNPALFALAVAAGTGDEETRRAAFAALTKVVRTGTHLFIFVRYMEQFRGWGSGMMKAVSRWYTEPDVDRVAYQVVKYRQREGWSHRDLLRSAHPGRWTALDNSQRVLFAWLAAKSPLDTGGSAEALPALVQAFITAQTTTDVATWVRLIEEHPISWEMLPDAAIASPVVWTALISKGLPITALIRQLPRLTRLGVLDDTATLKRVVDRLQDPEALKKGRVHPINLLIAMRTYASGMSERGSSTWKPKRQVIDAMDAAFYAAFGAVEPSGKRTLIALDVSGSMGAQISGLPISAREAAAAIALVTMATEPNTTVVGFTSPGIDARTFDPRRRSGFYGYGSRFSAPKKNEKVDGNGVSELPISPRQRLDDAVNSIAGLPFGGTDASLPMRWAQEKGLVFDTIIVITDNETWAGPVHVSQAMRDYRAFTGVPVREIVVGMTATDFTIADPNDPLTLDVAGFDSAVPNMIADFSRGDL